MTPAALPFVIGVTGHRDLRPEDLPELERLLRDEFDALRQAVPHSSLLLLSPLAEGADRLAARVAHQVDIPYIVPLPFARGLYEQDFATEESRREFATLLRHAVGAIELPLLPGHAVADVRQPGAARDREYAKLGAFVAGSCQILVALWDGAEPSPERPGGTAQVVRFRLQGIPPEYDLHRGRLTPTVPCGPVRHIVTPRRAGRPDHFVPLITRTIDPPGLDAASYERLWERIDDLNRDVESAGPRLADALPSARAQLCGAASETPAFALTPACALLLERFALTDALAVHFAGRTRATLHQILAGVAVTALLFHLHSAFYHLAETTHEAHGSIAAELPWALIGFLFCSAFTALWVHRRAERAEYQARHLDYRALAEALRVQFYWCATGLTEPVVETFLRKQHSELEWIRSALRTWHVLATAAPVNGSAPPGSLAPVRQILHHWIGDQRAYFVRRARLEQQRVDRDARVVSWMLGLAAAGTLLLGVGLTVAVIGHSQTAAAMRGLLASQAIHHGWLTGIGMLGVGAALLRAYGEQLARSEHARQYSRMSGLFDAAAREFTRLTEDTAGEAHRSLVRQLGVEALEDNADWLILHRERPLELPHG